jgi:hypothetical protein
MTRTVFASLGILAVLAVAPSMVHAQAPSDVTRFQQQQAGNVIGGGGASLSGGGDDRAIVYSGAGAGAGSAFAQLGRTVTFAGSTGGGDSGGGGPYFTYGAPPASAVGREAWLIGGGDDASVVYSNPVVSRR